MFEFVWNVVRLDGTAQVFVFGCLGGFCAFLVPNLGVLYRWMKAEKRGLPTRFRRLAFYVFWFFLTVLGGMAAWLQGDSLVGDNQLAVQIGLVGPLFISAVWRQAPDPDPGSVS